MTPQILTQQLNRQLTFLRNSAAAYDNGDVEEAVRIGVVIRVLCHDTANSTSLLKHMGVKASVQLVTTANTKPISQFMDLKIDYAELLAGSTFGDTITYNPVPEGSPTIACPDWWDQPVFFRDGEMYTRKHVVLAAANKDGGAHVDTQEDSKLRALKDGFWSKTTTYASGRTETESLENNHFRMLRRFADELLKSQELLQLVES
jgi:hypothetical protein